MRESRLPLGEMIMPTTERREPEAPVRPAQVTDRDVVSEPNRVIQVERVRVSREQQSSVTSAIRTGRQTASDRHRR
jgi:hypothetical protein